MERHLEILYKITHTAFINTAIQALSLIFTISLSRQFAADRFYRTLYESLLDTRLLTTSKQTMYLNLLFKAIRADTDLKRIKAFVKRMLQISGHHQPPFICGVLYLLSQVSFPFPICKWCAHGIYIIVDGDTSWFASHAYDCRRRR